MQTRSIITHSFIGLSVMLSLWYFLNPSLLQFAVHEYFIEARDYLGIILQIFISNFLHGDLLHLLFNMVFLQYFGVRVESKLGSQAFVLMFLLFSIISFFLLILLTSGFTLGMSGFILSLASYTTLLLWREKDPEYRGGITLLILFLLIGVEPGVSFYGHLLGVIMGGFFYILDPYLQTLKKKEIY